MRLSQACWEVFLRTWLMGDVEKRRIGVGLLRHCMDCGIIGLIGRMADVGGIVVVIDGWS